MKNLTIELSESQLKTIDQACNITKQSPHELLIIASRKALRKHSISSPLTEEMLEHFILQFCVTDNNDPLCFVPVGEFKDLLRGHFKIKVNQKMVSQYLIKRGVTVGRKYVRRRYEQLRCFFGIKCKYDFVMDKAKLKGDSNNEY
jgi:hypothetical protein